MVSEAFRNLENKVAAEQSLHNDLVGEIARKLEKDARVIAEVLYHTSVTVAARPTELAFVVNEFLLHLREVTTPESREQVEPESPFLVRESEQ